MRRRDRNPAERLRFAVEALPRNTRQAMLRGIAANRIIVGAYVDRDSGGICPMLAAHRNGGRTSLASFSRAWDGYTGAKRPRLATRRELRALSSLLDSSLSRDEFTDPGSIAEAAEQIRAERAAMTERQALCADSPSRVIPTEPGGATIRIRRPHDPGQHHRPRELRDRLRWSWIRPTNRYQKFRDLLAAVEEELADHNPVVKRDEDRSVVHPR
jgi:hypothetical protein